MMEVPPARMGALSSSGGTPLCFLHVPKSAGSSVHGALEKALGPGSISPRRFDTSLFCGFDEFDSLTAESRALIAVSDDELRALAAYPVVSGHFSLRSLLKIASATSIGTVLREPRARLLSLYAYWRKPEVRDTFRPYAAADHALLPLEDFLTQPAVAEAVDNQVCRMLLEGHPLIPESGFVRQSHIPELAAEAIEQIDRLGFAGVLELEDALWPGLSELFGVALTPVKLNVTADTVLPTKPSERLLSRRALAALEDRTSADRIVYDHLLARWGLGEPARARVRSFAFARRLAVLDAPADRRAADPVPADVGGQDEWAHLRAQIESLRADRDAGQAQIRELSAQLAVAHRRLEIVYSSRSWRLTAPLRAPFSGRKSRAD